MLLTVLTPSGLLVQERVDEIVAPGLLGEFCVLEGHLPILYVLRQGVVRYRVTGGETRAFLVAGGYFELNERGEASLLAPKAFLRDGLDLTFIEATIKRLEAELRVYEGDVAHKEELSAELEFYQLAQDFVA